MKFAKKMMLGTAAAALLAGFPPAGLPFSGLATPAQAATSVSVNVDFNVFYDRLQPYGDWVSYESAYVWVPREISADWRPYTRGHWAYTREYGWLWVSDEPFGWATYHYGRWGFAQDIGWYWVPAKRWAPAWVAWKRSDRYLAWAPLPPEDHVRVSVDVNIDVNRLPRDYWVAVESDRFLERDISRVAVYDEAIIDRAEPVGTVVVQNNTVINNVVNVQYIEKQTNQRVAIRDVRPVDNPERAGKVEGDALAVFNADVQGDEKTMKPKQTREASEVIDQRKKRGKGGSQQEEQTGTLPQQQQDEQNRSAQEKQTTTRDQSTGSVTSPSTEEGQATNEQQRKKKQQQQDETTGSTKATPPAAEGGQETADQAKKKKLQQQQEDTGSVTPPAAEGGQATSNQAKKKKLQQQDETTGTVNENQPSGQNKKKKLQQQEDTTGSVNEDQSSGQNKKKKLQQQEDTTGTVNEPPQQGKKKKYPDDTSGSLNQQDQGQGYSSSRKQGQSAADQEEPTGSVSKAGRKQQQEEPSAMDQGQQRQQKQQGSKKKQQGCDPSVQQCQ